MTKLRRGNESVCLVRPYLKLINTQVGTKHMYLMSEIL